MKSLRSVAAAGVATVVLILSTGVAGAHEGNGVITVESATDGKDGANYTLRVTWENDGHPAADAVVTATAVDPAGTAQTPVAMTAVGDGRYQAFVPLPQPGTWTVRFSVVEPTATSEVTRVVAAATTSSTTSTTARPTTTTHNGDDGDDNGNGGVAKGAVGVFLLLLILVGAGVGFRSSLRRDRS